MSLSLAISLFFIVTVFYIMIIDVFTMLFRITGLTEEKARFQVISLLTNSGYSTKESEIVVGVLPRRRLARTVMLFGYVFGITIVSVFVNMMISLPNYEKEEVWPVLIVVCALFIIFLLVKRIPRVKALFSSRMEAWGRKWIYGKLDNAVVLLDQFPKGVIASVMLNKPPIEIENKPVGEIGLREKYGIRLIFIKRGEEMLTEVTDDMVVQRDDTLVVFGPVKQIRQVLGSVAPETAESMEESGK